MKVQKRIQKKIDLKKMGWSLMMQRGDRTQKEVAEAVNISDSAIRMYESGKRIPGDTTKIALAGFYETTVEELFFAFKQEVIVEDDKPVQINDRKQK